MQNDIYQHSAHITGKHFSRKDRKFTSLCDFFGFFCVCDPKKSKKKLWFCLNPVRGECNANVKDVHQKKMNYVYFWGQIPGDLMSEQVLPALFHPGHQAAEAGRARHVVHEEHSVNVAIVVLHHGLSEALLSCCVPQLELVIERRWNGETDVRGIREEGGGWHWERGNERVRRHKQ